MIVSKEMAELVDDDVPEHSRRCDDQPPVERERAASRARAPASVLVANRQARICHLESRRLEVDRARDLDSCLLAIPAEQRRNRRRGQGEAADPHDVVALQAEVEDLRRLRKLPFEPCAMLEEQRVDVALRRSRRHDDLDVALRVDVDGQLPRATGDTYGNLDRAAADVDATHHATVGVPSDNADMSRGQTNVRKALENTHENATRV